MYICICIHTNIHDLKVYLYVYICKCTYIYICKCIYIYTHAHTYTYARYRPISSGLLCAADTCSGVLPYTNIYDTKVNLCVYMCKCTYIYTCKCVYTYSHVHTHTFARYRSVSSGLSCAIDTSSGVLPYRHIYEIKVYLCVQVRMCKHVNIFA